MEDNILLQIAVSLNFGVNKRVISLRAVHRGEQLVDGVL